MSETINKPRGTLDFIAKDKKVYDSIRNLLSAYAEKYGAEGIEIPSFEEKKLFVRGVGESSDIVSKEMFGLDVKGEHDYVLRPEFTAGVNRMVIENKLYASPDLPLRFYYCGPVFRFERPQKGRLRQLSQFGIEFFDSKIDIQTTLDALLLFYRAAEELLGHSLILKINFLGSFESRVKYREALKEFYAPKLDSMCEDCHRRYQQNVLRILDCKVPYDVEINKEAPFITDFLTEEDKKGLNTIISVLESLNISYKLDPRLVRGLDYYTGLVFELYDPMNMDLGAIGGGGQYGSLMKEIGGPDFEGIGFSYGMERLLLSLDEQRKDALLKNYKEDLDFFVIDLRKEKDTFPIILEDELRSEGYYVSSSSYSKALNGSLKMADRKNASYALIFDDYNPDSVIVKNLKERSQEVVSTSDLDQLVSYLNNHFKK